MDSKTVIDKLVENISFHVLAGPCNKNIAEDISKSVAGTPINVRIKLRHKNDVHRGFISVPKLVFSKTPEKLRRVSSDQTIMSFNLLMDTERNKKIMKKAQKRIFQLLRPGVCLGTQSDDEDDPYMPNSFVDIKNTTSVTKPEMNDDKRNFGLKKNNTIMQPLDESIRPPKIFLGKCKPGGCLDPPFGEEKYAYEPVLLKSNDERIKKHLNQNELQKSTLITYPSMLSSNELKVRKESLVMSHKIKEENHVTSPNTYAYLQSYYIPTRSKEISKLSYSENMEKNKDIENEMLHSKSKKIVSSSKDSILTPTGIPAEPVLPTSVNLSTIQSNVTTLQNNVTYFEEKYIEKTSPSYDFSFSSDPKSDNISEKNPHVSNIFQQSQILTEDSEISNNFKIKEHIQIISSTNKNEEFPDFQEIANIQKNSVEDGDKPNGVVHKNSIIIIAPIKNPANINDCKKFTEPELQNKIINISQTLSTDSIPINGDIDFKVLELKGNSSSSINNDQLLEGYLEKKYIKNSSSLLIENISDKSNTKYKFRDDDNETEIGENSNILDVKPEMKSLDKKIKSRYVDVSNKKNIESLADFKNVVPSTFTSSLNERKPNVNNDALDTPLRTNQIPFQQSALNIEEAKFDQDIKDMKLLSIIDSSENLSKSLDFQTSGTTLPKQLNQIYKAASETDSYKSNFEMPMKMNNKERDNVIMDDVNRKNIDIKSLEQKSSAISEVSRESMIQSEKREVLRDDSYVVLMIKKSLDSINDDITNKKKSDIKNKKTIETSSFENESLHNHKNRSKSISSQSTFKLKNYHETTISNFELSHTTLNVLNSNALKELEQASNNKDLTEINHQSKLTTINNSNNLPELVMENSQEKVNKFPLPINYDIINKNVSEISTKEIVEIKSFEIRSLNNHKNSIKSILSQSTVSLNKNPAKTVINKSSELRTINDLHLSQTAFINILNSNSLKEKVSNNKDFTESNRQSKLTNIENGNKLLELVMETIENEQEKEIKSPKRKQDSDETGYARKEQSEHLQTHKNVLKKELFYLDIALQMHINNNKQMIFKTIDSTDTSKINEGDSILLFKSELSVNDDEMKIPIDSITDIVIRVKREPHEKNELAIKGSSFSNDKPQCDTKQDNIKLNAQSNEGLYYLQDTMSSVYEQDLVSIETLLRALKEEIDVLVRNQILIREMLKVNKSMPARLVHANRKCACYRK